MAPLPLHAQTAGPKEETAVVEREAYFTAESDGAVPASVTSEFPPGVSCILIPPLCSTTTEPVTSPIGGAVDPVVESDKPDYLAPQPVEANTLPVGMLGGKPRYTSYLKFTLPEIPKGSLIERFDLILTQAQVSYALESPAFRQALLAGLVTYQNKTPDEFTKFVGDVATQTTPLADVAPTGVELCGVTGPWAAGASQDAAKQPPRDCIFGANGAYDATSKRWTFDLSLLAQGWLDGDIPNEGIYLGPLGANNLAFGDPDTSTNWQVSMYGKGATDPNTHPRIRYSFSEGFGDESFALDDFVLDEPIEEDLSGVVASADPFSSNAFDDSELTGAPSRDVAAPAARTGSPVRGVLAGESRPRTPWWIWLLLPTGLGMAIVYSRSIDENPPPGRAGGGALTRLMARDSSTTPPL